MIGARLFGFLTASAVIALGLAYASGLETLPERFAAFMALSVVLGLFDILRDEVVDHE